MQAPTGKTLALAAPENTEQKAPIFYLGDPNLTLFNQVRRAFPTGEESKLVLALLGHGERIFGKTKLLAEELGLSAGRAFNRAVKALREVGVLRRLPVAKSYQWELDLERLSNLTKITFLPRYAQELIGAEGALIDAKCADDSPLRAREPDLSDMKEGKESEQIDLDQLQVQVDFSPSSGFFDVPDSRFFKAFLEGLKKFKPSFEINQRSVDELQVLLYQYGRTAFESLFVKIVRTHVRSVLAFFKKCLEDYKSTHRKSALSQTAQAEIKNIINESSVETKKQPIEITEEMEIILSALKVRTNKEVGNQIELEILEDIFSRYSYMHIKTCVATMPVFSELKYPMAILEKECIKLEKRKLGRNCTPETQLQEVEPELQINSAKLAETPDQSFEPVIKTQEERNQEEIDTALSNIIRSSTQNIDQTSDELVISTNKELISRVKQIKTQKLSDWTLLVVKLSIIQQDIFEEFIEKSNHSLYLRSVERTDSLVYFGRVKKEDRKRELIFSIWKSLGLPLIGEKFVRGWVNIQ